MFWELRGICKNVCRNKPGIIHNS